MVVPVVVGCHVHAPNSPRSEAIGRDILCLLFGCDAGAATADGVSQAHNEWDSIITTETPRRLVMLQEEEGGTRK